MITENQKICMYLCCSNVKFPELSLQVTVHFQLKESLQRKEKH